MNKNNNIINLSQKNENGTDLSFSNMGDVSITKKLFELKIFMQIPTKKT